MTSTIEPSDNTVFPHRGGFRRVDRDDDYQPQRVTAPAVRVNGSVVEQAHAAMENAQSEFSKYLKRIPRDHYSAQGLRDQIAQFTDTDAARAVDNAVAQVRDRAGIAATRVDEVRRDLSPHLDTAGELRANRYWNRTRPILDEAKDGGVIAAARELMRSADRPELGTLLQELPAYLASRGQNADWIDAAVGQVVPEYGTAHARLTKAQQALIITQRNAESLKASFAQGHSATVLAKPFNYDPDK